MRRLHSASLDLTNSGWAPNPLSGPATNRAEAIEARAKDMIAESDVQRLIVTDQNSNGHEQNIRSRLGRWLTSINGISGHGHEKGKTYGCSLENRSDCSLVVVNVDDANNYYLAPRAQRGLTDQPPDQITTPESQAKSFRAQIVNKFATQTLRLPPFSFELESHVFAASDASKGPELRMLDSPDQHPVLTREENQTQDSNSEQTFNEAEGIVIPDEEISEYELPLPQHDIYNQKEYQNWSLNGGFFTPDDGVIEATALWLNGSLVLSTNAPLPSSAAESPSLMNDWRYIEKEGSIIGGASPPVSLFVEETRSLMDEPDDSAGIRNAPRASRRSSAASSGLENSNYVLPTIYPGMEHYPLPPNCGGEVNDSWSNVSRSLFDQGPPYRHRAVSTPVHLEGGGKD